MTDPTGPESGSDRVRRGGGSWGSDAQICRSALRNPGDPPSTLNNIGFRVCLQAGGS